jgi:hypothetical protein
VQQRWLLPYKNFDKIKRSYYMSEKPFDEFDCAVEKNVLLGVEFRSERNHTYRILHRRLKWLFLGNFREISANYTYTLVKNLELLVEL